MSAARNALTGDRRGLMFVLSSPSGAGKTTLAGRLLQSDPNFVMSVSATTRPMRPNEIHGRDYFFVGNDEFDRMLEDADVPATLVFTAAEIAADKQFLSRGMVREVQDPLFGKVLHAGIVPHVPENPGSIRWAGPPVGAHTDEILRNDLGLDDSEIANLHEEGVVS